MRSTLLISMTLFLAGLSASQTTLSLDPAQYVLAHSDGGSGGDKTGGGSGGARDVGGTGGEHVSESDASQFYDAPRAPIGDMTDIAPTKDVVSATSGARSTCASR